MDKSGAYDFPDGQEIRDRRKIKGWSPSDLGEKAGIGVVTVKKAERGLRGQLRNLSKIAEALGAPIEVIVPRLSDKSLREETVLEIMVERIGKKEKRIEEIRKELAREELDLSKLKKAQKALES